jgi:hypothetical protein
VLTDNGEGIVRILNKLRGGSGGGGLTGRKTLLSHREIDER